MILWQRCGYLLTSNCKNSFDKADYLNTQWYKSCFCNTTIFLFTRSGTCYLNKTLEIHDWPWISVSMYHYLNYFPTLVKIVLREAISFWKFWDPLTLATLLVHTWYILYTHSTSKKPLYLREDVNVPLNLPKMLWLLSRFFYC